MHEQEAFESSAVMAEEIRSEERGADEGAVTTEGAAIAPDEAEVAALQRVYPDFDPVGALEHPVLGPLMRGEARPTLRQLYEAVFFEDIAAERARGAVETAVAAAVESAVAEAVEMAVAEAVKVSEERLLGDIRARGHRPAENGMTAAVGVRMHPAVNRLTRRERAILAKRAENGETIQL